MYRSQRRFTIAMTPLTEDQLKKIRDDRKLQIMQAALKVFAENGIRLTKISMIATEAGISHGLLYHYFSSKEEVLHTSLEWAITNGTQELLQQLEELDLQPLEKIKYFSKIALSEGSSEVFRIIQQLRHSTYTIPQETSELIMNVGNLYITHLLPLIRQGQEQGTIIQSDPEELLGLYLNVISGIIAEGDLEWWKDKLEEKINLLLRMITIR